MTIVFFAGLFVVVSVLLLGTYRLKFRLGLHPLVAAIASMQVLQAILASSFYWNVGGKLVVSPGSTILFAGNLAILLVVFARSGAREARTILYAILIGNIVPSVLVAVIAWQIQTVAPLNLLGFPAGLLQRSLAISLGGIAILYIDELLAVLGFAWLGRFAGHLPLAVRLSAVLVAVLAFDTAAFVTLLFWGSPEYLDILRSGIVGKAAAGLLYGLSWGLYLQRRRTRHAESLRQVLDTLLFRQDLEALREAALVDKMTGLYNRRFYDIVVGTLASGPAGPGGVDVFAVLVADVDQFKEVNDTLGHAEGDEILAELGGRIRSTIREDDLAFRYGGDEFVVLLPWADRVGARTAAERLHRIVVRRPGLARPTSLTIGVAVYPEDGTNPETLFAAADTRLYRGKQEGRDRVVA